MGTSNDSGAIRHRRVDAERELEGSSHRDKGARGMDFAHAAAANSDGAEGADHPAADGLSRRDREILAF